MKKILLASALLVSSLSTSLSAQTVINVYNNYESPPFVIGKGGLVHDTVQYLNALAGGKYKFVLQTIPKARLVSLIGDDPAKLNGIIMFQFPPFLSDVDKQKFLWGPVVFKERDMYVFKKGSVPSSASADAFKGLTFGGIKDHNYRSLEDSLNAGYVKREDTTDESSNLRKLALSRIDFTLMSALVLSYYDSLPEFNKKFTGVTIPGREIERSFAVPKSMPKVSTWINATSAKMLTDPKWKVIHEKYNLE